MESKYYVKFLSNSKVSITRINSDSSISKEGFDLILDEIPNAHVDNLSHLNGALIVNKEGQDATELKALEAKHQKAAFNHQVSLGYDSNMMSLISGISSACAIAKVEVPSKCQACKDALDILWSEKYRRVQENDLSLDYSNFGSLPYSYTEVRAESEA